MIYGEHGIFWRQWGAKAGVRLHPMGAYSIHLRISGSLFLAARRDWGKTMIPYANISFTALCFKRSVLGGLSA